MGLVAKSWRLVACLIAIQAMAPEPRLCLT